MGYYLGTLGRVHAREERDASQELLVLPALLLDRLDDLPPARCVSLTGSRRAQQTRHRSQRAVRCAADGRTSLR